MTVQTDMGKATYMDIVLNEYVPLAMREDRSGRSKLSEVISVRLFNNALLQVNSLTLLDYHTHVSADLGLRAGRGFFICQRGCACSVSVTNGFVRAVGKCTFDFSSKGELRVSEGLA